MNTNYFAGLIKKPYHLSVGAVIVNSKKEICCHYFKELKTRDDAKGLNNFYCLMRETLEVGESLEGAVCRGLIEEFGITGEIITYLGSIKSLFSRKGQDIEKTTLYFLINLIDFNPSKRSSDDEERESEIQWRQPDFLISKMKEQGKRLNRSDLDESEIIERTKSFFDIK